MSFLYYLPVVESLPKYTLTGIPTPCLFLSILPVAPRLHVGLERRLREHPVGLHTGRSTGRHDVRTHQRTCTVFDLLDLLVGAWCQLRRHFPPERIGSFYDVQQ